MTAGVIALVAALAAASGLGLVMRRRASGIMKPAASPGPEVLTAEDLGGRLGRQATLVQFSTAFCAPCRPTRQLLAQVADMVDGVRHVDIDAAARLDLVRRLRISSTPTVLVLDQRGAIVKRASGLPRKADVIAALGAVVTVGSDSPVERA
ncbi:MAG TPA: thioredoxin family protein [Streptosporangiaceae bacterium]|nr:thioredoxin family protein [Streptosporangiaceae bacterium]